MMEQFWCFSQGGINQEEDKLWQMQVKYSKDKNGNKDCETQCHPDNPISVFFLKTFTNIWLKTYRMA